jgi:murein DD-endopeptidase MepM/ murein hydrolase activator NlpD
MNKKIFSPLLLALASVLSLAAFDASAVNCFPNTPTATPFITSNFGMRKHPKLEGVTRLHAGTDLRAPLNTPIYAAEGGMAIGKTGFSATGGNMVTILGNSGITTTYMHNNRIHVAMGDTIRAGQQISDSGNTGNTSAAPHLHFEVQVPGQGKVDARPYLCNPPQKADAGPDALLNPNAQQGGSTTTNGIPNNNYPPMGSGAGAATSVPQPSQMPDYAGMTVHEFLSAESTRRFGNPQWYRDINDPLDALRNSPDPVVRDGANELPTGDMKPMLWREILFMMNLKDFYAMEKYERRQRMEEMLAADLADRVNEYTQQLLTTLRNQAAQQVPR